MKKACPSLGSSLLVLVVFSPVIYAQSGSALSKPAEKSAAVYKSPEDERNNQSGVNGTSSPLGNSSEEIAVGTPEAAKEAKRLYASAMGLYEAGKLDQAIESFKQSARLKPDDAQTHYSLGMAYAQARSYKDASDSFRRALKYKPDWPEANFRAGMMAYVLGRKSQSIEAYNKLIKLNSPLANTLYKIINEENASTTTPGGGTSDTVQVVPLSSSETTSNGGDSPTVNKPEPVKSTGAALNRESRNDDRPAAPPAAAPTSDAGNDQLLSSIYRVGVGDILDIRLPNSTTSRSTLFTVIDGGLIDIAITGGPMSVAGLTTDEIQTRIAGELRRRAIEGNAPVTVTVRQYTSHTVIISGLVSNPGTRVLRREAVPLYVLMAEVQPRSDAARVTIMNSRGDKRVVELNDASGLGALVRPGDVITVSVRPQEFYYIAGRVNYPGQKQFQPGITLLQAILAAGGTSRSGDNGVDLSREGADGRLSTTRYNLKEIKSGKVQDPRLQAGDRIEVVH